MKKVLFVNPPVISCKKIIRIFDCGMESKGNYLFQPYSHLQLSSLFVDHHVKFIDCVADKISLVELLTEIATFSPDFLVSSISNTTRNEDLSYVREVYKQHPNLYHYIFGDLFLESYYREMFLAYTDNIIKDPFWNCYSRIEIEWLMQIQEESSVDAVKYGISKHKLFLSNSYRWPFGRYKKYSTIMFGWGCPYSCSYCPISSIGYKHRDVEAIQEELVYIAELGIKELYVADKSFGIEKDKTLQILNYMVKHNFKFSWSAYMHPNQHSDDLLKMMKMAGCHTIIVGIETLDVDILKNNNRNVKIAQIVKLIDKCSEYGIDICGDFIIGLPGEGYQSISKTIDFSCTSMLDYASFNIASPLPGTSIKASVISMGVYNETEDYIDSSGLNGVLCSDRLSSEEIIGLRSRALIKFYLRPRYLIRRFFKIRSLEHLGIQLAEMRELFRRK